MCAVFRWRKSNPEAEPRKRRVATKPFPRPLAVCTTRVQVRPAIGRGFCKWKSNPMSNKAKGRTHLTGATWRGEVAVRRSFTPNRITRPRRRCVLTRIPSDALADIDTLAAKWRETRGEAIGRIVRRWRLEARKEVEA